MTVDALKTWFAAYGALSADIDNAIKRIDAMRAAVETSRVTHFSDMPRGGGLAADDRIGAQLAEIEELEEATRQKIAEGAALRREYEVAICKIHSRRTWPDRRAILRMRYIDLCAWPEICEMMYHEERDYEDRYDTF